MKMKVSMKWHFDQPNCYELKYVTDKADNRFSITIEKIFKDTFDWGENDVCPSGQRIIVSSNSKNLDDFAEELDAYIKTCDLNKVARKILGMTEVIPLDGIYLALNGASDAFMSFRKDVSYIANSPCLSETAKLDELKKLGFHISPDNNSAVFPCSHSIPLVKSIRNPGYDGTLSDLIDFEVNYCIPEMSIETYLTEYLNVDFKVPHYFRDVTDVLLSVDDAGTQLCGLLEDLHLHFGKE